MTKIREVAGLFKPAWCAAMVDRLDRGGFSGASPEYPRSYRTNERWVADDAALAAEVFARARPHLPELVVDAAGVRWRVVGLNPRMRACRYRAGQWFGVHRDGVHWQSARERSWLSVLVYLDDGFSGGETRVFTDRHARQVARRVVPARGTLAAFEHTLWHDGAPIEAGIKHVLRTDVMYAREGAGVGGHLGYVWSLAALADGAVVASGGRDRSIRLWRGGREVGVVEAAHGSSVTCLASHGDTLISGSRDRIVTWWRLDRGGALVRGPSVDAHAGTVLSVATDGGAVVSAGADGALVWHGDQRRRCVAHDGWAWSVCAVGAGRFVSVGDDGRLVVTCAGERVAAHAHASGRAVCALPGERVAVGDAAGDIAILRLSDGVVVDRWHAHDGAVTSVAALPGGALASGGEDDRAVVWSIEGASPLEVHQHHDFVRAVCATRGGWVSAGYDGAVRFAGGGRASQSSSASRSSRVSAAA